MSIEDDIKATGSAIADSIDKSAREGKLLRADTLAKLGIFLIAEAKGKVNDEEWRAMCEIMGMAVSSLSTLEVLLNPQEQPGRTVTEEVESTGSATAH